MPVQTIYSGYGGFDPGGSARSNVDRYYTYRQTGGDGGGGGSGSPKGGLIAAIFVVVLLLYAISRIFY